MYLTDLAKVLRDAGLEVIEVPGWKTRGYRRLVGDTYRADLLGVSAIIAHHTATSQSEPGNYPTLATVRDGRSDLPGPLAQLGLGRDGTWYVIAAGYANHTGKTFQPWQSNSYALGIEAEAAGTGDPRDWPKVQMDSYARGVAALAKNYGVPVGRVLGHKEIAAPLGRKTDPSFNMPAFRTRVNDNQEDDMTPEESARLTAVEADVKKIVGLLTDLLEDGEQKVPPRTLWRRAVALLRRVEARQIAHEIVPVEVDVDAVAVAEALIERLPTPIAQAVLDNLSTRLSQ